MTSELPRVVVRVSKQQFELIRRLAKARGVSRGALVRELVEAVEPALTRTLVILERAREAPEGVKAGLRAVAQAAEARMTSQAQEGLGVLDLFVHAVNAPSPPGARPGEAVATAERVAPPVATRNPRPSNTGVRSVPPRGRKAPAEAIGRGIANAVKRGPVGRR